MWNRDKKTPTFLLVLFTIVLLLIIHYRPIYNSIRRVDMLSPTINKAVDSFYLNDDPCEITRQYIKQALLAYEECHDKDKKYKFPEDSLESLIRYMGHLAFRENKYEEALEHYNRAKRIFEKINKEANNNLKRKISYNFYLGWLHDEVSNFDSALWYYEQELQCIKDDHRDNSLNISLFNDIGIIKLYKNDYFSSLLYFFKYLYSVSESSFRNNSEVLSNLYTNIGTTLYEMGYYKYAIDFFNKSYYTAGVSMENNLCTFQNIALAMNKLDSVNSAKKYFNQACNSIKDVDIYSSIDYIQLQLNLLNFYKENNDFLEAYKLVRNISELLKKSNVVSPIHKIQFFYQIADLYKCDSKFDLSKKYYEKTIKINYLPDSSIISKAIQVEALYNLGKIYAEEYYKKRDNILLEQSLILYKESVKILTSARNEMLCDKSKLMINEHFYTIYKEYLNLLLEKQAKLQPNIQQKIFESDIIYISEFSKYSILTESKRDNKIKLSSRLISSFFETNQDFINGESNDINFVLENEIDNAIYSTLKNPPLSIYKNKKLNNLNIKVDEILMDFILTDKNVICYCRAENIDTIIFIGKTNNIQSLIHRANKNICKCSKMEVIIESLAALSKPFLQLLSIIPNNVSTIIFIPEGILNDLPFECLFYDRYNTEYLCEKFIIRNELSLSEMQTNTCSWKPSGNLSIDHFAPCVLPIRDTNVAYSPLSFSKNEVEIIDMPWYSRKFRICSYLNQKATIKNFKKSLHTKYFVHLSTHGECSINHSDGNRFIFNDNGCVEYFYQWDIDINRLKTEHIVLSCCSSGKGLIYNNEGIDSFVRTFYIAGVDDIIYTKWNIPDKFSAIYFGIYYKYLSTGLSSTVSMNKTKKDIIHSKYNHPYYWSCIKNI